MKTILVTGANGQLGQTFQDLFSKNKDTFKVVFVSKSDLNIVNKEDVDILFNKYKFDFCINCAAYTNVEKAETSITEAYAVNAHAVKNIAEVCKKHKTILIHISTDYVFNGKKKTKYSEEDRTDPINEYGKSKLLGEQFIQDCLKEYFIIRTSWLYSIHGKNFVKTIVNKIKENSKLQITTSQTGTPTSCIHLSDFIFFLIKNHENKFGIYHFSAIGEATWYDFALQISGHIKDYEPSNVSPIEEFNSKAERPVYSVLDNTKAIELSNITHTWQTGVDETVEQLLNLLN